MKDHAANEVSDEDFARRHERWPHDTPDTKEAYYIRDVFDSKFGIWQSSSYLPNLDTGLFPS